MHTDRAHIDLRHTYAPGLWSELSDMVARLRRNLLTGYRPERHYMRGPGPAYRARRVGV